MHYFAHVARPLSPLRKSPIRGVVALAALYIEIMSFKVVGSVFMGLKVESSATTMKCHISGLDNTSVCVALFPFFFADYL